MHQFHSSVWRIGPESYIFDPIFTKQGIVYAKLRHDMIQNILHKCHSSSRRCSSNVSYKRTKWFYQLIKLSDHLAVVSWTFSRSLAVICHVSCVIRHFHWRWFSFYSMKACTHLTFILSTVIRIWKTFLDSPPFVKPVRYFDWVN